MINSPQKYAPQVSWIQEMSPKFGDHILVVGDTDTDAFSFSLSLAFRLRDHAGMHCDSDWLYAPSLRVLKKQMRFAPKGSVIIVNGDCLREPPQRMLIKARLKKISFVIYCPTPTLISSNIRKKIVGEALFHPRDDYTCLATLYLTPSGFGSTIYNQYTAEYNKSWECLSRMSVSVANAMFAGEVGDGINSVLPRVK